MLVTGSDDRQGSALGAFVTLIVVLALVLGLGAVAAIIVGVWTHVLIDAFEYGWSWWERWDS